ncbi:uncharacterized protein [Physcomitrium patens]|uniref:uncharacterized protein isoform X2 n=1 Tax=Physcomitrium patens TaxID=3218 RepID=UPI000D153A4D|nr:transcription factor bHLH122-like isoform X2 [Physcomitrium patens]|eukprot:XP_024390278.1 transcription factor bHLH122-like isoform X2 [Physcomitrella patens]
MGSASEALMAVLSSDHDYSSVAPVMTPSNSSCTGSSDLFSPPPVSSWLQGSLPGSEQRLGSSQRSKFRGSPLDTLPAPMPEWPYPRDEKVLVNALQGPCRATNFRSNMTAPHDLNRPRHGGLQRYHSAPSSFLQCLDDLMNEPDVFPQASSSLVDSDVLLDWADDLTPITERGSQQMDTEKSYPRSGFNDCEQFLSSLTNFSSITPSPQSQNVEPTGSLARQDGLGGFDLPDGSMSCTSSEKIGAANSTISSAYIPEDSTHLVKEPAVCGGLWNCTTSSGSVGSSSLRGVEVTMEPPLGWHGVSSLGGAVTVGEPAPRLEGLIRHSSLPATSRPFSSTFELDDLQADPSMVYLKTLRANRGHATHPRSIAERVRRGKISERMKKLQELVPNSDRQTNTADMLDDAVEYVKQLQLQVQELTNTVAELQLLQERLGHPTS